MKKIDSLQALRGIAFLGIFFIHCSFVINWAGLGVSIFFVLSGFLMQKKYNNSFDNVDLKHSFLFAKRKISGIYPLHIILMLLWAAWIVLADFNSNTVRETLVKIFLNVTLTQSWVPDRTVNVCLNGVAWFLSSIAFHYFAFPFVSYRIRGSKKMHLLTAVAILLTAQVLSCWFIKSFCSISQEAYTWFMYTSPIFRFVDFFAGICLADLISEDRVDRITISGSVAEIVTLLITIGVCYSFNLPKPNMFVRAIYNGATLYIILSMIWVIFFYRRSGFITNLLSCKPLIFLGNISAALFLIHFPVTQFNIIYVYLSDNIYVVTAVKLAISIMLSLLYLKTEPYILNIINIIKGKNHYEDT